MRCRDVMVASVVTCTKADPASYCARLMKERRVGFLPVLDLGGRVAGVLTDRDLVVRLLAEGGSAETHAGDIMTASPVVCRPEEDLRTAEERMVAARTSRLVVVNREGRPVGVISLTDVAAAEARSRAGKVLTQVKRRLPAPQTLP